MATQSISFPGVITNLRDISPIPTATSRFRCGILGVTARGPFNEPLRVTSMKDFQRKFGGTVVGSYVPQAVQLVSEISDGCTVVRVGRQYEAVSEEADGFSGSSVVETAFYASFAANDYLRIQQEGKRSSVNLKVLSVSSGSVTVDGTLADSYSNAFLSRSAVANAANAAESSLASYVYDAPVDGGSGDVSPTGYKGEYTVTLLHAPSNEVLASGTSPFKVGDLVRISQADKVTTREARIKQIIPELPTSPSVTPAKLVFDSTVVSEIGFQPVPLQDTYTDGSQIEVVSKDGDGNPVTERAIDLLAASAGTWANSVSSKTGLVVTVGPGSKPDTKRFYVKYNGGEVEVLDNLVFDDADSADYAPTKINGKSSYISMVILNDEVPASTLSGWGTTGSQIVNVAGFTKGFNGENPQSSDYIGTYDESSDTYTGLQLFTSIENGTDIDEVDVICCPGVSDPAVLQEGANVAGQAKAVFYLDVPKDLNSREAVDWHNAEGLYTGSSSKIDSRNASLFWNWFSMVDALDGTIKFVPPSLGALRATAYTFDAFRPWEAAAGEKKGKVPAIDVQYRKIIDKDAIYGNGNSVNPIISTRSGIMIYGNRTLQRQETKLTETHNMILVNYILRRMSAIGRKFIFDPIDDILYSQIRSEYTQFLQSVQNERGLEAFSLKCDASNNTAEDRNNRRVNVDFSIIPTSTLERLFLNATVRESGAVLNTDISTAS